MPQYQPNYLYSPRYGSRYMGNNVHAPASGPLGAEDEKAAEAKKEAAQGNQQQPQVQGSPYGDAPPPPGQYDAWASMGDGREDVGSLGEFGFRQMYQPMGAGYGDVPQGNWTPPTATTTQQPDLNFGDGSGGIGGSGGGLGGLGGGTGTGTYGSGGVGEGSGLSTETNLGGSVGDAIANPNYYGDEEFVTVVGPDGSMTTMTATEAASIGEGSTVVDSSYGVWTNDYGQTVQVGTNPGQYSPELATQMGYYDSRSVSEYNEQQATLAEQQRLEAIRQSQNEFTAAQGELDRQAAQARLEYEQGAIDERQLEQIEADIALQQAALDAEAANQSDAQQHQTELQEAQIAADQARSEYEQGQINERQLADIEAQLSLSEARIAADQALLEYEQGAIDERQLEQINADVALQEAQIAATQAQYEYEQGALDARQLEQINADLALQEAQIAATQAQYEYEQGAITERQLNAITAEAELQEAQIAANQALLEYEQGAIDERQLKEIDAQVTLQEAKLAADQAMLEYEQGAITERELNAQLAQQELIETEIAAERARYEFEQGAITERQLNEIEAQAALQTAQIEADQAALEYEQGAITERQLNDIQNKLSLQEAQIAADKAQYEYEQGAIDERQKEQIEADLALQEAKVAADLALAEYEQGEIDARQLELIDAQLELQEAKIAADQALAEYEQGLIDERHLELLQAERDNIDALIASNETLSSAEIAAAETRSLYEQGQADLRALEEAERNLEYQQIEHTFNQTQLALTQATVDYQAGLINDTEYTAAKIDYGTADLKRQAELDKAAAELELERAKAQHQSGDITDEELEAAQNNYDNVVSGIDTSLEQDIQDYIDTIPDGDKIVILTELPDEVDLSDYDPETVSNMELHQFEEMKDIADVLAEDQFGYYTSATGETYTDASFLSDPNWSTTTGGVNYVDHTNENFNIADFTGDQLLIDFYEAAKASEEGSQIAGMPSNLEMLTTSEVKQELTQRLRENTAKLDIADVPEWYYMDLTEREIAEKLQSRSLEELLAYDKSVDSKIAMMTDAEVEQYYTDYNKDRLSAAGLPPESFAYNSEFLSTATADEISYQIASHYTPTLEAAGFDTSKLGPDLLGSLSQEDIATLVNNPDILNSTEMEGYQKPLGLIDGRWVMDLAAPIPGDLTVDVNVDSGQYERYLNNALTLQQIGISVGDLDQPSITSMDNDILNDVIENWNQAIENTSSILSAQGIDPTQFTEDYLATMSQYERQAIIDSINTNTVSEMQSSAELNRLLDEWKAFEEDTDYNKALDSSNISQATIEYLADHPAFQDIQFVNNNNIVMTVNDLEQTRIGEALAGFQENFTGAPVVVDSGGTGSLVTGGTEVPFTQAETNAFGDAIHDVKKFYDNAGILQYLLPGGIMVSAVDYLVNGGVDLAETSWEHSVDGVSYIGTTGAQFDPSLFTDDMWANASNATEVFDYDNPDYWSNQQVTQGLEDFTAEYDYDYNTDPNIDTHTKEVLHTLEDELNYAIMQDEVNQLDWANPETLSAMTGLDIETSSKVLSDFISTGESSTWQKQEGAGSAYDTVYGYGLYGQPDVNLTELSVADAFAYSQEQIGATRGQIGNPDPTLGTSAIGKYQFTGSTMKDVVNSNPDLFGGTWAEVTADPNQKFDQQFQDNLFMGLATMEGLDDYLAGDMTREQFQNNLASRWQSIPKADGTYIGGATHGLDLEKTVQMLEDIKAERINDVSDVTDVLDRYGVDYTLGTSEEDLKALDEQRTQTEIDYNAAIDELSRYGISYTDDQLSSMHLDSVVAASDSAESNFNEVINSLSNTYGIEYTQAEIDSMHLDSVQAAERAAYLEYKQQLGTSQYYGVTLDGANIDNNTAILEQAASDLQADKDAAERYGVTLPSYSSDVLGKNDTYLSTVETTFNETAYALDSEYGITYTDSELSTMHLDSLVAAKEAADLAYTTNVAYFEGTKQPSNETLATMSTSEAEALAADFKTLDSLGISYTSTSSASTIDAAATAATTAVATNKAIYEDAGLTPPADSELALMSEATATQNVADLTYVEPPSTYTPPTTYTPSYYSGDDTYSGSSSYYSYDYSGTGYSAGQYADYGYDDVGYTGGSSSSSGGK